MVKKTNSGGEATVIKSLQMLEDYKKVLSKKVDIKNPNGSVMQFIVHAITPERFAQLSTDYQQTKPERPLLMRNSEGKEVKDPSYNARVKKYERDLGMWKQKLDCWTVLAGWVEPEGVEINGKTDIEKVDELFKKIPAFGALSLLTRAIMTVSNLSSDDVDFM